MNTYQTIENSIACIKCECEELKARGVDPTSILNALDDDTKDKTPFDYELSNVRSAADAIENDMIEDVVRDIRRHCSTINIERAHLVADKRVIANIILGFVDLNLSRQIADALLAAGVSIEQ